MENVLIFCCRLARSIVFGELDTSGECSCDRCVGPVQYSDRTRQ